MAIRTVFSVGVISLTICVVHVVAVATPYWIVGKDPDTFYIGLFQICFETSCLGFTDATLWQELPFAHVGSVGLHIVGAILLFANAMYSLRHLRFLPDGKARSIVTNSALILGVASCCILAAVVWFPLFVKSALVIRTFISSEGPEFGYSFYLGVVAAAASIIVAIFMFIVASQMETPPTISKFVPLPYQPTVVLHLTTKKLAGPTYPMTSPVGLPQAEVVNSTTKNLAEPYFQIISPVGLPRADPAYGYDQ